MTTIRRLSGFFTAGLAAAQLVQCASAQTNLVYQDDFSVSNAVWRFNLAETQNNQQAIDGSYGKIEGGVLMLKANVGCGWDYVASMGSLQIPLPKNYIIEYRARKTQWCGTFRTEISASRELRSWFELPCIDFDVQGSVYRTLNVQLDPAVPVVSISPVSAPFSYGSEWHEFKVVKNDKSLLVYADNTLQWSSYTNEIPAGGFLHFQTGQAGATAEVDDLKIYDIAPNLSDGLVAYYPFNGNANDSAGTNDGTAINATFTTNRFGTTNSAILLNGSSYVGVNYSSDFDFPTNGQFSLSAWFKLTGFGSGAGGIGSLIVKGTSDGAWDYGLEAPFFYKLILWAGLNAKYPCMSTNLLSLNVWYHGVVTYSNASWKLYENGALVVQSNTSYTITRSTAGLAIGRKGEASTDYFRGAIDDVRIYNRALSPGEVQQLYANESTGLVAYYPFNGSANDDSGNGNNGALFGPQLAVDRFGNTNSCYSFDGVSTSIDFGTNLNIGGPYNAWTISLWFLALGDGPVFTDYEGTSSSGDSIFTAAITIDSNPIHSSATSYLTVASRHYPTLSLDSTAYFSQRRFRITDFWAGGGVRRGELARWVV